MSDLTPPPEQPPAAVTRVFAPQAVQMIRTVTHTNLMLSQMADQKASILMGATFVVFTIVVGQAGNGGVPLPLMVLALFSFLSALFAVAVVMPSVHGGGVGQDHESPRQKVPEGANMLFFGVFTQFGEDEFTEHVLDRIGTEEAMFRLMLRDTYQNGQVLQRKKYRYLGYAYRLFIAGLTLTLLSFLYEHRGSMLP